MDYLPLFFNLRNSTCLLVGGGEIALRKARALLRAHAKLKVVAPEIHLGLRSLLSAGDHEVFERPFETSDLEGVALAVGASDDPMVNELVSRESISRNLPVNIVDRPELCSVIFPAMVDRSPVVIAISTGGTSPVLARTLKSELESMLPSSYGDFAELLGSLRQTVKQSLPDFDQRLRFWEQVIDSEACEMAFSRRTDDATTSILKQLESFGSSSPNGEVYLVGAGPGDPDLLTLRALRLMQKADVVLYDRLVCDSILAKVRPDAERVSVGKERDHHPVPQHEINHLLLQYAKTGKRVLRLKGGDPFIFGRGGEEIESLMQHGVAFQVVPGITAASGCSAYAGIPLTHRELAQSVHFLTGHDVDGSDGPYWPDLIRPRQTLVFYMALMSLPTICNKLIAHGMNPKTPAAIVEHGTQQSQRVIASDITKLPEEVAHMNVRPPSLLIIGEVVKLHKSLAWFNS